MCQVLFEIPLPFGNKTIPVFGFGVMLLCAYFASSFVASRLMKREGYNPSIMFDTSLAIFVGGVIGARLLSLIYDQKISSISEGFFQFFKIWEGGMVLYGAIPGGFIGWLIVRKYLLIPNKIRTLQLADWLAPAIALGIGFGRIGCLLNGCCFGDYVDPTRMPSQLSMTFPANSPPYQDLIQRGWQVPYDFLPKGFGIRDHKDEDGRVVQGIPLTSPALNADPDKCLQVGDVIGYVNEQPTEKWNDLFQELVKNPQHRPLQLTIQRGEPWLKLPGYLPGPSIPLIPTQAIMALDGFLLFLFLWFLYPHKGKEGSCMAVLMVGYGINRFHIERIRLDNPEFLGPFTISQSISLLLILGGIALFCYAWLRPTKPMK